MKKACFFFFLLFSLQAFSQKVALKNNLAYDALLTPNLSPEFSYGQQPCIFSFQIYIGEGNQPWHCRQRKPKRDRYRASPVLPAGLGNLLS